MVEQLNLLDEYARRLSSPDWYVYASKMLGEVEKAIMAEPDSAKRAEMKSALKEPVYQATEDALREGRMPLAASGEDNDALRQPTDTVVIHHSKSTPGMSLARLNAIHLLRIYGLYYAHPSPHEAYLTGELVWSGHFRDSQQVFFAYHWFVRTDGAVERLLEDKYLAWHAGDYQVNRRSVAICFDDDLTSKAPSPTAVSAAAQIIREHYPRVVPERIVGHRDVNPGTVCPGEAWPNWRAELIKQIG